MYTQNAFQNVLVNFIAFIPHPKRINIKFADEENEVQRY